MSSAYDIQGRNCLFQMKIGDVYMDVVCAKTFSLNRVYELKETTTVQSGFDKEFRPRKKSYTISFNGVVQVVSVGDKPTIKTMFTNAEGFLPIPYRILYYDNSNNLMGVVGTAYVTSAVFDANPINLLNGTIELQGTGPIEVLDELPTPFNIRIVSTGDPSIGAFIQFKLINTDGEIMFDSGQLPEASGGNLSHPVDVTGQIESGSYYFFWQTTADSVGNSFSLNAPPTKTTAFGDGTQNENSFGVQIYDFTADRTVTFALGTATPPPTCVAPAIPGTPTLPNGQVGTMYTYSFPITGSTPFLLTNVTKPSWMSITVVDTGPSTYAILITGTPDVSGTGITVSFNINNDCGTVPFSDTIDIAAAPPTNATINWNFNNDGSPTYSVMRIFVNAVMVLEAAETSSGSFTVSPGGNVEAQVLAGFFPPTTRVLSVINTTDSITMYNNSSTSNEIFSFTAAGSKTYSITGSTD